MFIVINSSWRRRICLEGTSREKGGRDGSGSDFGVISDGKLCISRWPMCHRSNEARHITSSPPSPSSPPPGLVTQPDVILYVVVTGSHWLIPLCFTHVWSCDIHLNRNPIWKSPILPARFAPKPPISHMLEHELIRDCCSSMMKYSNVKTKAVISVVT